MDKENLKKAEDKIRDLINLVSVMNNEEIEEEYKEISDKAAKELDKKLRELAKIIAQNHKVII